MQQQKRIERVKEYKLLGVILDEHFELHSHVNKILRDGYSTLRTLKLLKRYAPYYLRKQLCESLILSKLDYCNILFKTSPQYQKNKMEKLLQSCAGFVKCKHGCKYDVIDLKWLLLEERIDSSILRLVYNGINKENMSANLKLELKKPTRTSRNNSPIIIAKDKNMNKLTLIEEANEIFKELPSDIKQEICTMSSCSFKDKLKKYLFDRTLARVLSSQI